MLQGQTDELTVRGQRLWIGGLDDCRVGEKEWNRAVGLLPQKEEIGLLFGPAFPPATSGCGISFFRLRTDLLRPCPWRADPPAGADQWAVCTRSGVVSALCWRGLFLGTLHIGGQPWFGIERASPIRQSAGASAASDHARQWIRPGTLGSELHGAAFMVFLCPESLCLMANDVGSP